MILQLRNEPARKIYFYLLLAYVLQVVVLISLGPGTNLPTGAIAIVPILLGALGFGIKGGVVTAVMASLLNAIVSSAAAIRSPLGLVDSEFGLWLGIAVLLGILFGVVSNRLFKISNAYAALQQELDTKSAQLEAAETRLQWHVTDSHNVAADFKRAQASLESANQAKDQFLATMSHELRTPLTMIMGHSDALREGLYGDLNDEQIAATEQIFQSSNHLLRLIDSILDFNRFNTQNVLIQTQILTVEPICIAALQLVEHMASQKEIALTFENCVGDLEIEVDETWLVQMLVNLLDNAIKYTPAGGNVGLTITQDTKSKRHDSFVNFEVWDEGIGIASEALDQIFEPFVQLELQNGQQHRRLGTGLGLSLVNHMVRLHHGTITVTSKPGKGSRFRLKIPVRQPQG